VRAGNLAPAAPSSSPPPRRPKLLKHKGRAGSVRELEDFHKRIDDPQLDIDEKCIMVLKNCGPKGLPRHGRGRQHAAAAELPEEGRHRHGAHLGCAMSGTAYGTVVLHISPEATAGGVLALCRTATSSSSDAAKGKN